MSPDQPNQSLQRWFATSIGQSLLLQERDWNHEALKRVYGVHLMQLGMAKENFAQHATGVHHPFVVDVGTHEEQSWAVAEGRDTAIPIATESLSAVILPHVLECSVDPYQVLREVTRVLAEDGNLMIFGISPWSFVPLFRRVSCVRPISAGRLTEWLTLLGYEVVEQKQLPLLCWSWRSCRLNSGIYQLVARRRVVPLNPLTNRWGRRAVAATSNAVNRDMCRNTQKVKFKEMV
ncbi:MAG: methyltransferase domain-containing protein [Gammaproteobacteria bacterium]|nr:methyltransferase domain-containing protein [Gammaproteobacteria bacterium]